MDENSWEFWSLAWPFRRCVSCWGCQRMSQYWGGSVSSRAENLGFKTSWLVLWKDLKGEYCRIDTFSFNMTACARQPRSYRPWAGSELWSPLSLLQATNSLFNFIPYYFMTYFMLVHSIWFIIFNIFNLLPTDSMKTWGASDSSGPERCLRCVGEVVSEVKEPRAAKEDKTALFEARRRRFKTQKPPKGSQRHWEEPCELKRGCGSWTPEGPWRPDACQTWYAACRSTAFTCLASWLRIQKLKQLQPLPKSLMEPQARNSRNLEQWTVLSWQCWH